MENENQNKTNQYYLKEFELFDGEYDVKFNIFEINFEKHTINVAITKAGKISVIEFDLLGSDDNSYFEYGPMYDQICVNDFETIED